MNLSRIFLFRQIRFVGNLPRNVRLELDESVNEQIKSENRKLAFFKEHKGKFHMKNELPKKLEEILNTIISDVEPERLRNDVKQLDDHLAERRLPIEKSELEKLATNVIENLIQTEPPINTLAMSPEKRHEFQLARQRELVKRLKSSIYHWQPLSFDEYRSKIYLATNFASHYSMLVQIFNEIKQREKSFRPVRLFDFGSGVGSVMWAALHVWGKRTFAEILNVDKSREMNKLSQLILQEGQLHKSATISGVVYRQFLPHGRENTFDLVVADHTLFEFENQFERFRIVRSLWQNVKPGGFLVLVERGNLHGYTAINEARENLLNRLNSTDDETEEENRTTTTPDESLTPQKHCKAHIFSPCSHDLICPKKNLNVPCRISTRYRPLQIFDLKRKIPDFTSVQMSYVVVKKSERDENDVYGHWPRVIEPIIDRRNHQHVRLCCPTGDYVNVPISKNKHGAALHRLSHHAAPGDLFPVSAQFIEEEQPNRPIRSPRRAFRR